MRVRLYVFLIIIIFVCFLGGCELNGDDGKLPSGDDPILTDFFDISLLNYNPNYTNVNAPEEKGFIINDKVDLNLVVFKRDFSFPPNFILKQGETTLSEIKRYDNESYPLFEILTSGAITVEIYFPVSSENIIKDTFTINVIGGGFPTRVEMEMYDEESNKITTLMGGENVTFKAKVFSDDVQLTADDEKFKSGWKSVAVNGKFLFSSNKVDGKRDVLVALPNLPEISTVSLIFEYTPTGKTLGTSKTFSIEAESNLEKLSINWGLGENSGNLDLSYNFGWLLNNVDAHYLFTNGDTQDLNVNFQANSKDGDLVPFIRYNDEDKFNYYTGNEISYAASFEGFDDTYATRYIANGVKYYFHPLKNSAEVYLAHRYSVKAEIGTRTMYRKADVSALNINFTKDSPQNINATSITGSELEHYKDVGIAKERYITFSRNVINGKTNAKIYVKNTKKSTATTNNQYFRPNVEVTGAVFQDYYYRYNWHKVQRLNNGNFYSETAGCAEIEIISCQNPDIKYTLTVDIQNPIMENRLQYFTQPNLYVAYDPSPYVRVEENFYNYDTKVRSIAEDEVLRYYDYRTLDQNEVQTSFFIHQNRKYDGNFIIRLSRNGEIISSNYLEVDSYISPNYYIEIAGIKYLMSEFPITKYSTLGDFTTYLPYIEIESESANITIYKKTGDTYIQVTNEEAYVSSFPDPRDGTYYIYYKNFEGSDITDYSARICAVKFING